MVASISQWLERVHPDDLGPLQRSLHTLIGCQDAHLEQEHRLRHDSGEYIWVLTRAAAVRDRSGRAYRLAGSHHDVTRQKALEAELEQHAYFDSLTGLCNRLQFMGHLEECMKQSHVRGKSRFVVLFLDLDRFKLVNDSLGHVAGDRLLVGVAKRLATALRPSDIIARVSGDEFVILLRRIEDISTAERVADRLLQIFSTPFYVHGHEIFTSASIGIASNLPDCDTAESVIRNADLAMYRAKSSGRRRHEVYDAEMHRTVKARLELESELRRALERDEFRLLYQPICELGSGRVAAVEALLRWQHPERGLLQPAHFLDAAEETGVLTQLSEWILHTACRDASRWASTTARPPCVGVNVSSRQFWHPKLCAHIADALQDAGLDARALAIEVTEGVLIEDVDSAIERITDIQNLGVSVHIDDFGRGHSSLSFLARYPVDALKIDRQFIASPLDESWQIVEAVLALSRSLEIAAIAEGIEEARQRDRLIALDCQLAQGFFFSRPVPAERIGELTAAQGNDRNNRAEPPGRTASVVPADGTGPP